MPTKTLKDIAESMKDIDICMFNTVTKDGKIAGRPMSNNREVEYDGNSYYFTNDDTDMVADIRDNPQVGLAFQDKKHLYIAINGKASIITDKTEMEEHWVKDLDEWFKQGVDTPGVVMIHVGGERVKYWQEEEEGEVKIQ